MITRVTGKNQITIPAALARELNITAGTELAWSKGKKPGTLSLYVKPTPEATVREIRELGAPYRAQARQMLADLEKMREEDDAPSAQGEKAES
jgi:AbrB family looped-hinge helix DNA binding protein